MISTCKECTTPCCQAGPGPHKNLSPEDYLAIFATAESYNTKCIGLTAEGKCNLWGTPDLPVECRNFVCQTRQYSKEELSKIDDVIERDCPTCGCEWMLGTYIGKSYHDICEVCGYTGKWSKELVSRGKRKWNKKKIVPEKPKVEQLTVN